MCKSGSTAAAEKKKVIYFYENIMEVGLNHSSGYTTLRIDIQDMPADLRKKIKSNDEDTLNRMEEYLDDYYSDAEIDSISMIRGESGESLYCWKEIFYCCGILRGAVVKIKGAMFRILNCV